MMHLGLSITGFGHHPDAWRGKGSDAPTVAQLARQVLAAEAAGLDFVFFGDRLGQRPGDTISPLALPFEPTTLVSALATLAKDIGFVATAATAQYEPYNLARRFASLDIISGGRAGWNLVSSGRQDGWDAEYAGVVSGLWDSWDDDAFVYDKAAGRFFVAERMHVLQHVGQHFSVRGPLNVNRSPQGRPVITHVLTPDTIDIAVCFAEVVVIAPSSIEQAMLQVTQLRTRIGNAGRNAPKVKILAVVSPWVKGQEDFARLSGFASSSSAEPTEGLTIVGAPSEIADFLQHWFASTGIDGFLVQPPIAPEGTEAFVQSVVPLLRQNNLFRHRYTGTTLRDHLGLPRPDLAAQIAKDRTS